MFLVSGLLNASEVTYSLTEMAAKIIQSSMLTPSGKVFLMDYFKDLVPMELELNVLSQELCEQATHQDIKLFIYDEKNCNSNLNYFLTIFEKGGEISAGGSVTNGPDGPVYTASVGIKVTW